ncbi:MAG: NAD-dependent deacylase [Chloroflexi bacterium]|nr:NAD-dependent deacylase [Chloroflexota bacterium]
MTILPEELVELIQTAPHVAALTGAGVSAESGVPTFREAQTGLWAQYDPQQLATPAAFQQNPRLVWEWYMWRRGLISAVTPNPGHLALVELEKLVPQLTLITQNVDGLHAQAGSQNIIELHGNIMRTKCFAHNHPVNHWVETEEAPPRCPQCDSLLRPDVVWFGESLPAAALHTAINAAQTADLFFSIGTSALVQPAASLPIEAMQNNVVTVEINLQATPITPYVTHVLSGPAGEILPALLTAVKGSLSLT